MKKPIKTDSNRDSKGKFKPGNNANPKGRPKSGHAITDIIRELGDEKDRRRRVLSNIYSLAEAGEKWACEFVAGYDQGRPVQTVDYIENKLEPVIGIVIDKPE